MLERLSPARRNLALSVLGALLLWFAWSVRAALNPLIIGLLFAYMLHPMVLRLERRGWSRKLAVNVIFSTAAVTLGLTCVVLFLQGRSLWRDVATDGALSEIDAKVATTLRDVHEDLVRWGLLEPSVATPSADNPNAAVPPEQEFTLRRLVDDLRRWLASDDAHVDASAAAGGMLVLLRRLFGSALTLGALLLLVPLYTWFLLFELERIGTFVRRYIPRAQREHFARIGSQIAEMLGNFFRGRLLVCLLKGLVLSATLRACGVPYALLLGMTSGFLSLVPFVGALVGYALMFLVGLLDHTPFGALWRVGVVFAVGEGVENYVLLPKVLGDSLGLHPVVVIASLMIAGSALGMFGLLIALPLTATVIILARELVLPALRDMAEGRSRAS